jgi:transcriptional regulator with XRE-family HTH domain
MTGSELVREVRLRHGLSQRRLAVRAGTSQAWISRIEQGKISPSIESLERLLLVMGENLDLRSESSVEVEDDATWREAHLARPMAERLERAFDAAAFAADLRGSASPR